MKRDQETAVELVIARRRVAKRSRCWPSGLRYALVAVFDREAADSWPISRIDGSRATAVPRRPAPPLRSELARASTSPFSTV
jgi:hypothetical protein